MTVDEAKQQRRGRLKKLSEAISNLPEVDGKKMHGEMDVVMFDAVQQSNKRDKLRKEAFKDKNKETREFIKDQDKATGASKEDAAEDKLMLDESLFNEDISEEPSFRDRFTIEDLYASAWESAIKEVAELLEMDPMGAIRNKWDYIERVASNLKLKFNVDGELVEALNKKSDKDLGK